MRFKQSLHAGLSLIAAAIVMSGPWALAGDAHSPTPLSPAEIELRRATQEGERASRENSSSRSVESVPDNGIVLLPIKASAGPGSPPCPYNDTSRTASLLKVFADISWHVCVSDMGLKGLWVGPVEIRRTANAPWITVLKQAGLAEIFVPYHRTPDFRFWDLEFTSRLHGLTKFDAGSNGTQFRLTHESVPTVIGEVRDRGVAWLCKQDTMAVRRGEEFVVWGVTDAGNYDNIIQYTFRDDGSMTFRMGNTGYNSQYAGGIHSTEPHMHDALWYVDMDVNGPLNDTAYWVTHSEPVPNVSPFLFATDRDAVFGTEGARQWDARSFTALRVQDSATNAFGHALGYEFTPAEAGISRHFGQDDNWTRNDVYVTIYHPNEMGWSQQHDLPDHYLLPTVNGEPAIGKDLVIWMKISAHHGPTDEDHARTDHNPSVMSGVTLVHWSGFDVEPDNLFNANPMGGPERCGP